MTSIQEWMTERSASTSLGPKAARVVEVIKTHPHLAAYASTSDLAARAGVNVATVVRTAQGLGFTGWPEMRLELRSRYLATLSANQVLNEHADAVNDPVIDALRRDIENLETTARTVDTDAIRGAAASIVGARRVLVVGSGSFAAPGVQLSYIAGTMGLDISLERHGGTQLASEVTRLGQQDCIVVFNLWWQPREIIAAVQLAHERNVAISLITDRRGSSLATIADPLVIVPSEGVSSFPSLTTAMAVVHALLAEIARLGGAEVETALKETEATWTRLGLFDEKR